MTLVVAALLLTSFSQVAIAAEKTEHQSNNAHRVIIVLDSMGVNNPTIRDFIGHIDDHIQDGYLTLSEQKVMNGKLMLHYQLNGKIGSKQLEMKFTPDNSHMEYTATSHQIMATYTIHFR
jgi:hypothetical protein